MICDTLSETTEQLQNLKGLYVIFYHPLSVTKETQHQTVFGGGHGGLEPVTKDPDLEGS